MLIGKSLLKKGEQPQILFCGFGAIVLLSIFSSIFTENYYIAAFPALLLIVYWTVVDMRKVFYLLFICLPLSTEVELPNGFGTDLPTEPLIIGLMLAYILYIVRHSHTISSRFLRHPLTLLLGLHLIWTLITALASPLPVVSIKFFLAKIWYVTTFYFLSGTLLKNEKDLKPLVWGIIVTLLFTVIITLVRHANYGFSFKDVNKVLHPFYRNHVAYAAIMGVFFPFLWLAIGWVQRWTLHWWLMALAIGLILVAIQFAYTRAVYVAIIASFGVYFVIKMRMMRVLLMSIFLFFGFSLFFFIKQNNYLEFAPDYNKTITHDRFDNLIEATYKMQDISTMERVYRWVAGFQMANDKLWLGFGPGNFYNFYKKYTLTSFRTYVSDNPEHSGIHNYFLMILVEQGVLGLIFFLTFVFYTLICGERIYHQVKNTANHRIILAAISCLVIVNLLLLMNDLIETDKVGSFFFMSIALLVNFDILKR